MATIMKTALVDGKAKAAIMMKTALDNGLKNGEILWLQQLL